MFRLKPIFPDQIPFSSEVKIVVFSWLLIPQPVIFNFIIIDELFAGFEFIPWNFAFRLITCEPAAAWVRLIDGPIEIDGLTEVDPVFKSIFILAIASSVRVLSEFMV